MAGGIRIVCSESDCWTVIRWSAGLGGSREDKPVDFTTLEQAYEYAKKRSGTVTLEIKSIDYKLRMEEQKRKLDEKEIEERQELARLKAKYEE
jgi:hypothetical protein